MFFKRCPTCGKFMRKLKLVEKCAIEANGGGKREFICRYESFTFAGAIWTHE